MGKEEGVKKASIRFDRNFYRDVSCARTNGGVTSLKEDPS